MITILALSLLLAAEKTRYSDIANPSDFKLSAQVQSATLVNICGSSATGSDCGYVQHLAALIDGKHYQLNGTSYSSDILQAGTYKAKIQKDDLHGQKYQETRIYRLLFPDGRFADYLVVAKDQ